MSKYELQRVAYERSGVSYEESQIAINFGKQSHEEERRNNVVVNDDDNGVDQGGGDYNDDDGRASSSTTPNPNPSSRRRTRKRISIYEVLGGDEYNGCLELSTLFYNRVFADTEHPAFLNIFASSTKQEAIDNQVNNK